MIRPSIEISPKRNQPLVDEENDLERSMIENKGHVDAMKSRNSWVPPKKAYTTRGPMKKRGSELKRMTKEQWGQLANQVRMAPPIDRNNKPAGPNAPAVPPNRRPPAVPLVPPLNLTKVKRMAGKFQSSHTGGPPFP